MKTHQMFSTHTTLEKFQNSTTISIWDLFLRKRGKGNDIIIVMSSFLKSSIFKFLHFEEHFRKAQFLGQISVDRRPNCWDKVVISNFSHMMCLELSDTTAHPTMLIALIYQIFTMFTVLMSCDIKSLTQIRVWARIWLLRVNLSLKVIFGGTFSISEGRFNKHKRKFAVFLSLLSSTTSFPLICSPSVELFSVSFWKVSAWEGLCVEAKKLSSVRTRFSWWFRHFLKEISTSCFAASC